MQLLIKTYHPKHTYPHHHFFILSKGNNAGKPLDQPCPNCFVVITNCPSEKQRLYWLCFWAVARWLFSSSPVWIRDSLPAPAGIKINLAGSLRKSKTT